MLNNTIQIKVKSRLNKNDSEDYPDIPCWSIAEAFNLGQSNWVRRQFQGINGTKTGTEGSITRIDDLNVLLTQWTPTITAASGYYETSAIPADYMRFSRVSVMYKTDCCPPRRMISRLKQVGDVNELLRDFNERPSPEWAETFHVIESNKLRIYTNDLFTLEQPSITYYRQPRTVVFANCMNVYDGLPSLVDVECELPDDVIEVIINEACQILGGDIDNFEQANRAQGLVNNNT
jgi:hypothetical protein